METIINLYYANNAKQLHTMVDRILLNFGGIYQKDIDDFYSLANLVFVDLLSKFDRTKNFDTFLYSCLLNRIKTEITRRNREKRQFDRSTISIDEPAGEEETVTLGELIPSDFDIEKELFGEFCNDKMNQYLNRLSKKQREIALLLSEGYKAFEIREKLQVTEKEFTDCMSAIRSYEYIKVLMQ